MKGSGVWVHGKKRKKNALNHELDEDVVKIALKKKTYALSHVLDEDVVKIVDLLLFKRRKLRNGTRLEGG